MITWGIAGGLWLAVAVMVVLTDPQNWYWLALMVITAGSAVYVTLLGLMKNKRRSGLMALGITLWLLLRLIKLAYWFNALLILGLMVAIDSIFTKQQQRVKNRRTNANFN